MTACNNFVLIGFMGSGKSTVGALLAEKLGWELIDTDKWIVHDSGKTVPEIFEQDGEPIFREWETKALIAIAGQKNKVIATGGGIVMKDVNQVLLKKLGRIIYLQTDIDTVNKRIPQDANRPLLSNDANKLGILLHQRHPIYTKLADRIIDARMLTQEEIVGEITNYELRITN